MDEKYDQPKSVVEEIDFLNDVIPYRCPKCGDNRKFTKLGDLRLHLETDHSYKVGYVKPRARTKIFNHEGKGSKKFIQDSASKKNGSSVIEGLNSTGSDMDYGSGSDRKSSSYRKLGSDSSSRKKRGSDSSSYRKCGSYCDKTCCKRMDREVSPLLQSYKQDAELLEMKIKLAKEVEVKRRLERNVLDNKMGSDLRDSLNAINSEVINSRQKEWHTADALYQSHDVLLNMEQAAEKRCREQQEVIQDIVNEFKVKENQLSQATTDLEKLKSERERLMLETEELLKNAGKGHESLREELNKREDMLESVSEQLQTIKQAASQELQRKEGELEVAKNKLESLEVERNQLMTETQELSSRAGQHSSLLKRTLEVKERQLRKVNKEMEKLKTEQKDLIEESVQLYKTAKEGNSKLQDLVKSKDDQLSEAHKELHEMRQIHDKLVWEANQLTTQADENNEKLKALIRSKEEQLQGAQVELEQIRVEQNILLESAKGLQEKVDCADGKVDQLQSVVEQKEAQLAEKERELESIKSFLHTTAEKESVARGKLETFIGELIDRADNAEKELRVLKSQSNSDTESTKHKHKHVTNIKSDIVDSSNRSHDESDKQNSNLIGQDLPMRSHKLKDPKEEVQLLLHTGLDLDHVPQFSDSMEEQEVHPTICEGHRPTYHDQPAKMLLTSKNQDNNCNPAPENTSQMEQGKQSKYIKRNSDMQNQIKMAEAVTEIPTSDLEMYNSDITRIQPPPGFLDSDDEYSVPESDEDFHQPISRSPQNITSPLTSHVRLREDDYYRHYPESELYDSEVEQINSKTHANSPRVVPLEPNTVKTRNTLNSPRHVMNKQQINKSDDEVISSRINPVYRKNENNDLHGSQILQSAAAITNYPLNGDRTIEHNSPKNNLDKNKQMGTQVTKKKPNTYYSYDDHSVPHVTKKVIPVGIPRGITPPCNASNSTKLPGLQNNLGDITSRSAEKLPLQHENVHTVNSGTLQPFSQRNTDIELQTQSYLPSSSLRNSTTGHNEDKTPSYKPLYITIPNDQKTSNQVSPLHTTTNENSSQINSQYGNEGNIVFVPYNAETGKPLSSISPVMLPKTAHVLPHTDLSKYKEPPEEVATYLDSHRNVTTYIEPHTNVNGSLEQNLQIATQAHLEDQSYNNQYPEEYGTKEYPQEYVNDGETYDLSKHSSDIDEKIDHDHSLADVLSLTEYEQLFSESEDNGNSAAEFQNFMDENGILWDTSEKGINPNQPVAHKTSPSINRYHGSRQSSLSNSSSDRDKKDLHVRFKNEKPNVETDNFREDTKYNIKSPSYESLSSVSRDSYIPIQTKNGMTQTVSERDVSSDLKLAAASQNYSKYGRKSPSSESIGSISCDSYIPFQKKDGMTQTVSEFQDMKTGYNSCTKYNLKSPSSESIGSVCCDSYIPFQKRDGTTQTVSEFQDMKAGYNSYQYTKYNLKSPSSESIGSVSCDSYIPFPKKDGMTQTFSERENIFQNFKTEKDSLKSASSGSVCTLSSDSYVPFQCRDMETQTSSEKENLSVNKFVANSITKLDSSTYKRGVILSGRISPKLDGTPKLKNSSTQTWLLDRHITSANIELIHERSPLVHSDTVLLKNCKNPGLGSKIEVAGDKISDNVILPRDPLQNGDFKQSLPDAKVHSELEKNFENNYRHSNEVISRDTPEPMLNTFNKNQTVKRELGNQYTEVSVPNPYKVISSQEGATTALSTQGGATTALSTQGRATTALSTQGGATTALSTQEGATTALSTEEGATTALSTQGGATTALSTQGRATTALSTQGGATTALSTQEGATTALSTEEGATTALSTQGGATTALSTQGGATTALSTQGGATTAREASVKESSLSEIEKILLHLQNTNSDQDLSNSWEFTAKEKSGSKDSIDTQKDVEILKSLCSENKEIGKETLESDRKSLKTDISHNPHHMGRNDESDLSNVEEMTLSSKSCSVNAEADKKQNGNNIVFENVEGRKPDTMLRRSYSIDDKVNYVDPIEQKLFQNAMSDDQKQLESLPVEGDKIFMQKLADQNPFKNSWFTDKKDSQNAIMSDLTDTDDDYCTSVTSFEDLRDRMSVASSLDSVLDRDLMRKREEIRNRRNALFQIFSFLDTKSLIDISLVCKEWRKVSRNSGLWKIVSLKYRQISAKFLLTISTWCTQTEHLILEDLKPRDKYDGESDEGYHQKISGSLEPGLEQLLQISESSLKSVKIINCGLLLTDKSIWLVSCYSRVIQSITYISDTFPVGADVMWAVGSGCRDIRSLIVPPKYPCSSPEKFDNKCLQIISQCCHDLVELSIGGASIDINGLVLIAKSCQRLLELDLHYANDVTEDIATAICRLGLKSLQCLRFIHTPVNDKAILQCYKNCKRLKEIEVHLSPSDFVDDINTEDDVKIFDKSAEKLQKLLKKPGLGNILKLYLGDVC